MRVLFLTIFSLLFISANATEKTNLNFHNNQGNVNIYDLLLTVGMDEVLDQSAVEFGAAGFNTYLGWDQGTVDTFRASAIEWFKTRFGIDFTNGYYDIPSGTVSIPGATLVPLSFSGKYRVLSSNNPLIRDFNPNNPAQVRLAEYVAVFSAPPTYSGSYVAEGSHPNGEITDTLAFGCYRVSNKFGPIVTTHYDFFMRSYYPNKTDPASLYPARSTERFQMYSELFGPGFGTLTVAVPTSPNAQGKFPTFTRASWSFPVYVVEDWNQFNSSPIH